MALPQPRFDQIPPDDPRWMEGARLFNRGRFFERHESWESLWHEVRGRERGLLKGLIQWAAAYHHLSRRNISGAQRLYTTGRAHVAPWAPRHAGLRVEALVQQVDGDFARLEQGIIPSQRPTIQIDAAIVQQG